MIGPCRLKDLSQVEVERIIYRRRSLESIKSTVQSILEDVRKNGDEAVLKYTRLFDKVDLPRERLKVTGDEITRAYKAVPKEATKALKEAANNIAFVHRRQLPRDRVLRNRGGIRVEQIFKPIERVGIYVPGGRASYPSTALMAVIPAKVAGVSRISVCTPPNMEGGIDAAVLVALDLAGADEIYKVGGAQAIGAMAYGTETIPCVDKIFGPGNIYVSAAKGLVYGQVGVDFQAGPSEILIYADETASPLLVAADILSQAEHDPDSVAVLVTSSEKIAHEAKGAVEKLVEREERSSIINDSLAKNSAILIVEDEKEAIEFINRFAPEHLELLVKRPKRLLRGLRSAGSISIGPYTPVAATDYAVGSNHILPTANSASFTSSLTVYDFMKAIYVQTLTKGGLRRLKRVVSTLAKYEGFSAHAHSVDARFVREVHMCE
ncbi:MAG: histidinol dehydrogenase [Candidatus Bathyarchaeia archaeon]